jgi:hypothetical protein
MKTSRLRDRVNVAMMGSKIGRREKICRIRDLKRVAGTGSKETPETNFQTFPSFPQSNCNVYGCDTIASAEGSTCWVSGAALVRFESSASVWPRTHDFRSTL